MLKQAYRLSAQTLQESEFSTAMSTASSRYLSGARIQDYEHVFLDAASKQDAAARASRLDKLSFRIVGPYWGGNIGHLSLLVVLAKLQILGLLSTEKRLLCFESVANRRYYKYVSCCSQQQQLGMGAGPPSTPAWIVFKIQFRFTGFVAGSIHRIRRFLWHIVRGLIALPCCNSRTRIGSGGGLNCLASA